MIVCGMQDGWQLRMLRRCGKLSASMLRQLSGESAAPSGDWLSVEMPAQVQDVLLRHGRIPDPRQPGRARECLWVWERDWVYRKEFPRPHGGSRVRLCCLGLDTFVDVYVNGRLVAEHDDQRLPLRTDITAVLRPRNVLLLHVRSAHRHLRGMPLPRSWDGRIAKHRLLGKTHEDFGPFLGAAPYFTHAGVYDEVRLEVDDGRAIDLFDIDAGLEGRHGKIDVRISGDGEAESLSLVIRAVDPTGKVVARSEPKPIAGRGGWRAQGRLNVRAPALWWPRGYGAQPLYAVTAELREGHRILDRSSKSVGFRDLRLDRSFDLRINGRHVKLWGANFIPLDGLTYVWDAGRCRTLLDLAENAHMNTLRAWGPGEPYHESFFDECDRRGILVWHEFQHTWGPYPEASEYRARCRRAAEDLVRRRKHHPCILLWCGANETQMGCEAAGFRANDYPGRVIFERDYRAICRRLDPQRYYHPTSPTGGRYANDPLAGDSHSYTHQNFVPGERYPVIFTEHTRNSPPSLKTLRRVLGRDLWPRDGFDGLVRRAGAPPLPRAWMAIAKPHAFVYGAGCEPGNFFDVGDTPEGLIRRFAWANARYIRETVERYRRGRPVEDACGPRRCMGHYWWKLNSAWPEIYSELIDFYLEPKMSYYAMRRAYRPLLVSLDIADHVWAWVVNDTAADVAGTLTLSLLNIFSGRTVRVVSAPVRVRAGDSVPALRGDALGMFPRQQALIAKLVDGRGRELGRSVDFAMAERHLAFPKARLRLRGCRGGIVVSSDAFARCVELNGEGLGWRFEDNFFDVLPGETKRVCVLGKPPTGVVTARSLFSPHTARVQGLI